ncbi:MAG: hypothetical protein ACOCTN_06275 [Candidatus Natronoplasma sp.]
MARCMFVDDWDCPVERDEFPLEICKICVEARSIHESTTKLKVPENGGDGRKREEELDMKKMLGSSDEGAEEEKPISREELNKQFHEGEISVDEYIKQRKNAPKPDQR